MKKIAVVMIALLVLLSFSFGCKEEGTTGSARPASSGEGTGLESGSAESGADVASGGSDWADKFSDFVRKKSGLKYKIVYSFESPEPQMDGTRMTYYVDGDRMRTDVKVQDIDARTYIMDGTVTTCTDQDGWQCMQVRTPQNDMMSQFDDIEDYPDKYDIDYAGTRQIAGKTAICYDITVSEQGETVTMTECFAKEGAPLYLEVVYKGQKSIMEAESFSTSVRDSDFDLPAEPQDMTAMMEQAMANMPEGYEMPDY